MSTPAPNVRRRIIPVFAGFVLACVFLVPMWGCGTETASEKPQRPATTLTYDASGAHTGGGPVAKTTRPPNLVVIVVDTLRGDAVAAPGEPGGLMPFTTSLAKRGVMMRDAVAPSPWTVPSMASLVTGMLPSGHGNESSTRAPRLHQAVTTYAEIMRSTYGYETAAYTSGPWMSGDRSVLQGFTHGSHLFTLQGTAEILDGFVRKRDASKPFFLLLHTYEAHDPYGAENHPWPRVPSQGAPHSDLDVDLVTEPWQMTKHFMLSWNERQDLLERHGAGLSPIVMGYTYDGYRKEPRPELAADLRTAYNAGVTWVDGLIKKAHDQLDAWGMLENTVFVVTSDHGEAFGEHGTLAHGRQLYDELIRVPMVMTGPAPFNGGRALSGGVGLHDLLPTFLDHLGGEPLHGVHGRSFLPLLKGQGGGRPVFAEETLTRENTNGDNDQMITAVRSARWKYIITFDRIAGTVIEEAYDLQNDPLEQIDLCAGTGRVTGLTFDADFCRAVEQARDRIWGAAQHSEHLYGSPYGGGRALVTSQRPAPCGEDLPQGEGTPAR